MLVTPVHCNLCLASIPNNGSKIHDGAGFGLITTNDPDAKWAAIRDARETSVHICTDCIKGIVALDKQGSFEVP